MTDANASRFLSPASCASRCDAAQAARASVKSAEPPQRHAVEPMRLGHQERRAALRPFSTAAVAAA